MLPQFRYKCKQALCTPINNAHLGFSESSKIVVSSVHSLLSKNGKKIACHLLYIPKSYTFLHFPTLADALETRSGSDFPTLPTLPTLSYTSPTLPMLPTPRIPKSLTPEYPHFPGIPQNPWEKSQHHRNKLRKRMFILLCDPCTGAGANES